MQNRQKSLGKLLQVGAALICVLAPFHALALDPERSIFQYNCQTWSRANGLPANSVNAIAQTTDGLVWFGTSQGLVSFDGIEFSVANPAGEGTVAGKVITSVAARAAGGLWYGLDHGGFGFYDDQKFHPMDAGEWNSSSFTVRAVAEARDGALMVASSVGAARVTGGKLRQMLNEEYIDVFSVYEDNVGRTWIGTAEKGLFFWRDGKLAPFTDETLRNAIISAVAMDQKRDIWVGTSTGTRHYGPEFQFIPAPDTFAQPRTMLVDSRGVLWIGTYGSGLIRYYRGQFTPFQKVDGLASDQVLSLAESKDGSLWVGTQDGLTQLSDVKFPTYSKSEGFVQDSCLAVASGSDGSLWAGSPNGVSRFANETFKNYGVNESDGVRSTWIKRIFVARNGDAYFIGARKNIDRFRDGRVITSWTNNVWPRAIAEDSHGLLVAMAGDLMRLEHEKMAPYRLTNGQAVSLGWINDMIVARDDSIWLACENGVCQIKDGDLHNWTLENGLPSARYYYLVEDDHGGIWAAQGGGIVRFKPGSARLVNHEQGLHEDYAYAIVPDKLGNFWIDSNRGIFRVSQSELNAVADGTARSLSCSVFDGLSAVKTTDLAAEEYSGCRTADGRIWFPSSKGIIMIDPTNTLRNPVPPVISIQRVRVNGQDFSSQEKLVITPGPGNLEFGYSALDYRSPLKVQYRYKLVGYDNDWVNAGGRRAAFYTNLKPGRYSFHVKACNADGVWSTTDAGFAVELPRRFYETVWFRAAVGLAVLGLGVYFWWVWHLRQRQTQLQQANAQMEIKVRERTAELAEINATLLAEVEERKRAQAETERLQSELLDASRQAGQAEVASSVLHNVGNVLNSINVSTSVIANRVRGLRSANLAKAVEMIRAHHADLGQFLTSDKRGSKIPVYLDQVARHLASEQEELSLELKSLCANVEHIKEIVAMQQTYAKVAGVSETVSVADLVECALKIQTGSFIRPVITLIREFEDVPMVTVDRHKVLQILVNLLKNAGQACDEGDQPEKRIVVRIKPLGKDNVRIEVTDNGIGISAENLTRIFSHGFTTREHGHGFGLHSAALAANEMGGSVTVSSEGLGKGATFVLQLPVQPVDRNPWEKSNEAHLPVLVGGYSIQS